jgi:peroxiredoxin
MDANTSTPTLERLRLDSLADVRFPLDWRSHAGSRGLLVVLIHGMWCPACLERLVWLRRRHAWLSDLGIGVLAVSIDQAEHVAAFQLSLMKPLPFALVSDAEARLSRALGLYTESARTLAPLSGAVGVTRPALLLLDCAGRVRFAQLDDHAIPEQAELQREIEQLPAC